MLAKAEDPAQLKALEGYSVIALCETAAGVLNAPAIAAEPNVAGLMWGAEDLIASLGGTSSRTGDGGYRAVALHARSTVLLAAGAFGKEAIDSGLRQYSGPGRAGRGGPRRRRVRVRRQGLHPPGPGCRRPRRLRSRRKRTSPRPPNCSMRPPRQAAGVFQFNGKMIDGPILKHAESVLRRAGR